jgi:hypothetical protein
MKSILNLFAFAVLTAGAAQASVITISFDNPNQIGVPGQTLNFFGVISNTDSNISDPDVFLNADTLNFTLADGIVTDNFFANVPVSLASGASSGDIDLFDITLPIPESQPLGVYSGNYTLFGGADGGANTAQDNLAEADFSVDAAPEPGSIALGAFGLLACAAGLRRRQARA